MSGARVRCRSNGLWKYVSVRRLFIFLERSIYEGTQWVVFEPNDERAVGARQGNDPPVPGRDQWRSRRADGPAPKHEAFFISCGPTTMTQDDIVNGRLDLRDRHRTRAPGGVRDLPDLSIHRRSLAGSISRHRHETSQNVATCS